MTLYYTHFFMAVTHGVQQQHDYVIANEPLELHLLRRTERITIVCGRSVRCMLTIERRECPLWERGRANFKQLQITCCGRSANKLIKITSDSNIGLEIATRDYSHFFSVIVIIIISHIINHIINPSSSTTSSYHFTTQHHQPHHHHHHHHHPILYSSK